MTGQLSDKKELTWQEWEKMENDNTVLVDLREEVVYHHGSIPGAVCIPLRCFAEEKEKLPKDKCIVVFCQRGEKSLQVVEELRKEGRQAYHLEGGFLRWLIDHAKEVNMERYSRHVLLDEVGQEGQEKLLASKVLVVGAGGLGAPVALYLRQPVSERLESWMRMSWNCPIFSGRSFIIRVVSDRKRWILPKKRSNCSILM